jgi:hypothetical protein
MKKLMGVCLAALSTTGCLGLGGAIQQHEPKTQLEAGAVTLSATSTMRWDDVVDDLRPEFNSPSAYAHWDAVLPAIQGDYSSQRRGVSVQGRAAYTDELTSYTRTTEQPAGAAAPTTTTRENETRQAPSVTNDQIDDPVSAPAQGVFGSWEPTNPNNNTLAVNPQLRAQAAVALHQELVMLDHYLDEAYNPCLYQAWLVRTRLVVTPYARNQPYDIYTRLTTNVTNDYGQNVRVLPLLVTDNFERSDTRRYEQAVTQLQANLTGLSSLIAAGVGFNSYLNSLNALLGSQYNNTLTVSQPDNASLLVRLGASFSPTSRYEMQSRSYDITYLVLLPREGVLPDEEAQSASRFDPWSRGGNLARDKERNGVVTMSISAVSEFRHAESGELLPVMTEGEWDDLMDRIEPHVTESGRQQFRELRRTENRDPTAIWFLPLESYLPTDVQAEISRLEQIYWGSTADIDLSRPRVQMPPRQVGVFRDVPGDGLYAHVSGSSGLREGGVVAHLYVLDVGDDVVPAQDVEGPFANDIASLRRRGDAPARQLAGPFLASSVRIERGGEVRATFPSLSALGINPGRGDIYLGLARSEDLCPAAAHAASKASDDRAPAPAQPGNESDPIQVATAPRLYPLLQDVAQVAGERRAGPTFEVTPIGATLATNASGEVRVRLAVRSMGPWRNPAVRGYLIQVEAAGGRVERAERLGDQNVALPGSAIDRTLNAVRVGGGFDTYEVVLSNTTPGQAISITVDGVGEGGALVAGERRIVPVSVAQR